MITLTFTKKFVRDSFLIGLEYPERIAFATFDAANNFANSIKAKADKGKLPYEINGSFGFEQN